MQSGNSVPSDTNMCSLVIVQGMQEEQDIQHQSKQQVATVLIVNGFNRIGVLL